jgi:hypothetical protein
MKKNKYCCDNFRDCVMSKKVVKIKSVNYTSPWLVKKGSFRIDQCPFCGDKKVFKGSVHFDFASNPSDGPFPKKIRKKSMGKYCCSKFKDSVKDGKFIYAYKYYKDIDETEWFMPDWYHLYYCPFCGKYIKGQGFGHSLKRNEILVDVNLLR